MDWKKEFKAAVIRAIIANGSPRSDKPSGWGWGWIASDWERVSKAVRGGEIDFEKSSYTESDWHEFMGTFYEGDTRVVGMDATIVMTDGETFVYRWSGSASDLIQSVIAN